MALVEAEKQMAALAKLAEVYDARAVGRNLSQRRRRLKMTATDLAALADCSSWHIAKIERGDYKGLAAWKTIPRLVRALLAAESICRSKST